MGSLTVLMSVAFLTDSRRIFLGRMLEQGAGQSHLDQFTTVSPKLGELDQPLFNYTACIDD